MILALAIFLTLVAAIALGLGLARMAKLSSPDDQEPYGDGSLYNHPGVRE